MRKIRFAITYYFGLTFSEIMGLVAISATLGTVLCIWLQTANPWVVAGVSFSVFLLGHMFLAVSRLVALSELICFVACINWIIAPWLSYVYPPPFFLFVMNVPATDYFSFVVPGTIAMWIGMHLPIRVHDPKVVEQTALEPFTRREKRNMDWLILFGVAMSFAVDRAPGGFRFFLYILAQLRFVGALCFMFTKTPGWKIRIGLVYALLLFECTIGTLFYEFVLWGGYLFIGLAYIKKWKARFVVYLLVSLVGITILNSIKGEYRNLAYTEEAGVLRKLEIISELLMDPSKVDVNPQGFSEEEIIGEKLVRWNQGWIISRVISTVPSVQPYAGGETLTEGLISAFLPRILAPSKLEAGSRGLFAKYTDVELQDETAMGLGVAGELYANFGYWGGIFSMAVYGFIIGYLFSIFVKLAHRDVLWWAWVPFALLTAIEAEWHMADTMNHIVKSLMVMTALLYFVPFLKKRMIKKKKKEIFTSVPTIPPTAS